jgi:hypothetical protein
MDFPGVKASKCFEPKRGLDQVLDVSASSDLLLSGVSDDHRVYFRPNIELNLDVTRSRPTTPMS